MERTWFCNGVNAIDGSYLRPPGSLDDIARELLEGPLAKGLHLGSEYQNVADFGPADDADADDLSSTGWCVIFAEGVDPSVHEALEPLLTLRKAQANGRFEGYREFAGDLAFRPKDTSREFMARWRPSSNSAAEKVLPYYVLLVGSPVQIPYDFQYALALNNAVGRIHFDSVEDYAHYAKSVVAAESKPREKHLVAFGVRNEDDATPLVLSSLLGPILERLVGKLPRWRFETVLAEGATKARLLQLLHRAPAVLFTASHGLAFPGPHARQEKEQGAIVCSDWPGPQSGGIGREHCVSALDLPRDADLGGTLWFQFACFSGGTPGEDDFRGLSEAWIPAKHAFVSGLAKRALSLPDGRGAAAVIGHVDRIWTCSFFDERDQRNEANVFEQFLFRLLSGRRVGHALEHITRWHANSAVRLAGQLFRLLQGAEVDRKEIARSWLICNDARNYVIVGDPAVRVCSNLEPL